MSEQMTIFDLVEQDSAREETGTPPAEELFKPDGRKRCPHCRQRLHAFAGRLYCLAIGCSGGAA